MEKKIQFLKIARQILEQLPDDTHRMPENIKKNLASALQATFSKLELVSRDEFDIQAKLLGRTRVLLETLEKRIEFLEKNSRL